MPNAAKTLTLIATFLAVHTAQAADQATGTEAAVSASAPAPPPMDGAQLFASHCAMCHKPAELARRLQGATDPEAARASMLAFLSRHARADPDADAAIVDYLAQISLP